jgi:Tfp pilus assembly protein PilN
MFSFIKTGWNLITSNVAIALSAVIGVMALVIKALRAENKSLETEVSIKDENNKNLKKAKKTLEEIDAERKKFDESQNKQHTTDVVKLEKLKNETDDSVVVDDMLSLYNKNNSKD